MSYTIPAQVVEALEKLPQSEREARRQEVNRVANEPRSMSMFPAWSTNVQHRYLFDIATKRIDIGS